MNLQKLIFTKNACYMTGHMFTSTPKLMLHSTGANNPTLKRYVGPNDGLLGENIYNNHWNQYTPDGRYVCVHGFIGKLADGSIATYQTLPWEMRGWHAGGNANITHIGIEICEDGLADKDYFNAVYKEAVEVYAYLCKELGSKPSDIISHKEGHALGIASNHGDVEHWFSRFDKTMDDFRQDVTNELNKDETKTIYRVQVGAFSVKEYADMMANDLRAKGYAPFVTQVEIDI